MSYVILVGLDRGILAYLCKNSCACWQRRTLLVSTTKKSAKMATKQWMWTQSTRGRSL